MFPDLILPSGSTESFVILKTSLRIQYTSSHEEVHSGKKCDLTSCGVAIVGHILRMRAEIALCFLHMLSDSSVNSKFQYLELRIPQSTRSNKIESTTHRFPFSRAQNQQKQFNESELLRVL